MSQHQKALRLADELMQAHKGHADEGPTSFSEAATELRRLHQTNLEWQQKAATWFASPEVAQQLAGYQELGQRLNAAEAQRDELLAALQEVTMVLDRIFGVEGREPDAESISGRARAAIAKATEGAV